MFVYIDTFEEVYPSHAHSNMAPKNKKMKGKAMKITDFASDYIADDVYDYVDDSWMTEEQAKEAKLAEKIGRREYSRTANNALCEQESFRTTDQSQQVSTTEEMIAQLEPPYVAHFGNLRNGLSDEDFLALFHQDVVKSHRMVKQEGKTFAFVEFSTANALVVALMLDKTFQNKRQMYVNLANKKQIERLLDIEVDSPASSTQKNFGSFSRDAFGSTSNLNDSSSVNSPVGRDKFGSHSPTRGPVDLTRDAIGSAFDAESPPSPASPMSFDNWRNEESGRGSEGNKDKPSRNSGSDGWRKSGEGSPVSVGNWRSEKSTEEKSSEVKSPVGEGQGRRSEGQWRGGDNAKSSFRSKREEGSPTSKPSDNAGDDRWGNFRN